MSITEPDIRVAIDAEGTVLASAADELVRRWMSLPNDDRNDSLKLRKIGTLMTKGELKLARIRTNSKITHEALSALTDDAKLIAVEAYGLLTLMAMHASWRRETDEALQKLSSVENHDFSVRVFWHHRCRAAMRDQAELGDEFSPCKVPDLPRPGCDFSVCGCCISHRLWEIERDHAPQSTSPNLSSKPNIITRLLSLFTKP